MSSSLTNDIFLDFIETYAQRLQTMKDLLNTLDNRIGDGDHGTNMSRGFSIAVTKLHDASPADVSGSCQNIAMTLLSNVGGASGPLYSTVFMRLMSTWKGLEEIGDSELIAGIHAALEGLIARGKASVGEKTMIDVWTPVLEYCQAEHEVVWPTLVDTAKNAALQTKDLVAKKGRASYLGERSKGTCDPGSVSSAVFFESLASAFVKGTEPIPWETLVL